MDKGKTAEERAKEYADKEYSEIGLDLAPVQWTYCQTHFLAGRQDFIENDLRGLLEMARANVAGQKVAFAISIDQIIQMAKEGKNEEKT